MKNLYSKLIFTSFLSFAVLFSAHAQQQAIKTKSDRMIGTGDFVQVKGTVTSFDKFCLLNADDIACAVEHYRRIDADFLKYPNMRDLLRTELVGARVNDQGNMRVFVRGGDIGSCGIPGNNGAASFMLDGIIVENIDFLNPMDVKSVTFVKDAAGAGIYGSRGANGVVLINTKY